MFQNRTCKFLPCILWLGIVLGLYQPWAGQQSSAPPEAQETEASGPQLDDSAPPELIPDEPELPPDLQKFAAILPSFTDFLAERYPLNAPVVIRLLPMPGYWGLTVRNATGFVIYLNPALAPWAIGDTIAHEWAHAMAWDAQGPQGDGHDELWGVAYSRTYRALLEWLETE